jgi:SAM-dependent methyltransferase
VAVRQIYLRGRNPHLACNLCGWQDERFASDRWHAYAQCPQCQSKVRHRLFWAIVQRAAEVNGLHLVRNKRVLHFAPDKCLTKQIAAEAAEYVTADWLATGYRYRHLDLVLDMSNMSSVPDASFDCVIALDVLEHVPDHRAALREVCRILSPGGCCIFTVPQQDHRECTDEDLSPLDARERELRFGQRDHWRIYGHDVVDLIDNCGFDVTVISEQNFEDSFVEKHVLFPPVLSTNPLATNYRKVYVGRRKPDSVVESHAAELQQEVQLRL